MPFKNCRGNETKQKLVDDYDIVPLSFLKLLPNQEKQGCCGVLKDKYYVFEYQNKQNIHEKGSFFVGYDCGEQFLNLLNIDKSLNGENLLTSSKLYIIEGEEVIDIVTTTRINIDYAEEYREKNWRFYINGNKFVSKK